MKSSVFWDMMSCSTLKVIQYFGGASSGSKYQYEAGTSRLELLLATCFHTGVLIGLFDPEDRGDMFL
jgi:hypothetical protein